MKKGIFEKLMATIAAKGDTLSDKRRTGHNFRYTITNALMSAFLVFYFQFQSMLAFQQSIDKGYRRQNLKRILNLHKIPSAPQIKTILDSIEPGILGGVFYEVIKIAEKLGLLNSYKVLDGGVLIDLDGTTYHSSKKIHCKRCLKMSHQNGLKTFYHSILAAAIVKFGDTVVLPLMGELISNGDGQNKQDCEHNAIKRWLMKYGQLYKHLNPTFLGDALFACYSICKEIIDLGLSFIFTCKEKSHQYLFKIVRNSKMDVKIRREWNGNHHLIYRYYWLNGVDIRKGPETLKVNYVEIEIEHEEAGEVIYKNSWVTNKTVSQDNVVLIVNCARARWKIENEHNNVLKNQGYNLKHNFGHGENHASENYCLLNILAFLFHGILMLSDENYQKARATVGRRTEFFSELRAALKFVRHNDWDGFLLFVRVIQGPG